MRLGLITTERDIEDLVYLKVDTTARGMVTGIVIRPRGHYVYLVTWADHEESVHHEGELTDEKGFEVT